MLNEEWLSARLEQSLLGFEMSGIHDLHIDVPATEVVEDFAHHPAFFDRVRTAARETVDRLSRTVDRAKRADSDSDGESRRLLDAIGHAGRILRPICQLPDHTDEWPFASWVGELGAVAARVAPANADRASATASYILRQFASRLDEFAHTAEASTLLVVGRAGAGKSHLISEFARRLSRLGRPTVVLTGRRFQSGTSAWLQAMAQLGVPQQDPAELLDLLEGLGKRDRCRPLVIIDALNEGAGTPFWSDELATFLARARRRRTIGIVLSIRPAYLDGSMKRALGDGTKIVEHTGFDAIPVTAAHQFFAHYGVEPPTAPLFLPEYRNPLMLKLLCEGLRYQGASQQMQSIRGSDAIFDFWFESVNESLSHPRRLDYLPTEGNRVKQALMALSRLTFDRGTRTLPVKAVRTVVDDDAPVISSSGRSKSMYRELVREGILREDRHGVDDYRAGIAYDRLADLFEARVFFYEELEVARGESPRRVVELITSRLRARPSSFRYGVLRELSVLTAEVWQQELIDLVPTGVTGIESAFLDSLVWRSPSAFTAASMTRIDVLARDHVHVAFDLALSVAVVPRHPLNANWLHDTLLPLKMPDRDERWSTWLFTAWQEKRVVYHLVEWAHTGTRVPRETARLFAIALGWCLTASHRGLRDRATTALVSLLSDRIELACDFVEQFRSVDDPYVVERVYAVAHGIALRARADRRCPALDRLARLVYETVFSRGMPPPHVILRDHARGVIESAAARGLVDDLDLSCVRPPYRSNWRVLPSHADLRECLPNRAQGGYDSGSPIWSHNAIGHSIERGDFGRYVVESTFRDWLSVTLDESEWDPRREIGQEIDAIVDELTEDERSSWEEVFRGFTIELERQPSHFDRLLMSVAASVAARAPDEDSDGEAAARMASLTSATLSERPVADYDSSSVFDEIYGRIRDVIEGSRAETLIALLRARAKGHTIVTRPTLPIDPIKRLILHRVFDLGWSVSRFGEFDRFIARETTEEPGKAERIGKKYQWIAYHEAVARVADRFQYSDDNATTPVVGAFAGPWQFLGRDIDPSCTLRSLPNWKKDEPRRCWWKPAACSGLDSGVAYEDWIQSTHDVPPIESVIHLQDSDGVGWLNMDVSLKWAGGRPVYLTYHEASQREFLVEATGYLIDRADAPKFAEWAETVDFWEIRMPQPYAQSNLMLGEMGWSPAWQMQRQRWEADQGWVRPATACPGHILVVGEKYSPEFTHDASIDDPYSLHLPSGEVTNLFGWSWAGRFADFIDRHGQLIAHDPAAHAPGPGALLVRRHALSPLLARHDLTVCWVIRGEKREVGGPDLHTMNDLPRLRLSGACYLADGQLLGCMKFLAEKRGGGGVHLIHKAGIDVRLDGAQPERSP